MPTSSEQDAQRRQDTSQAPDAVSAPAADRAAAAQDDGTPKFGRLLIVLIAVVVAMGLLTWASEAYYS